MGVIRSLATRSLHRDYSVSFLPIFPTTPIIPIAHTQQKARPLS